MKNNINKKSTKNSTIEKIKNIVSDVVYYFFNSLGISSQPGKLMLPKCIRVSEERFNEILSTVTKVKNESLKTTVDGREITLDNTERLLKDLGNGKMDGSEFRKEYNNIVNDVETIVNRQSQEIKKK